MVSSAVTHGTNNDAYLRSAEIARSITSLACKRNGFRDCRMIAGRTVRPAVSDTRSRQQQRQQYRDLKRGIRDSTNQSSTDTADLLHESAPDSDQSVPGERQRLPSTASAFEICRHSPKESDPPCPPPQPPEEVCSDHAVPITDQHISQGIDVASRGCSSPSHLPTKMAEVLPTSRSAEEPCAQSVHATTCSNVEASSPAQCGDGVVKGHSRPAAEVHMTYPHADLPSANQHPQTARQLSPAGAASMPPASHSPRAASAPDQAADMRATGRSFSVARSLFTEHRSPRRTRQTPAPQLEMSHAGSWLVVSPDGARIPLVQKRLDVPGDPRHS